MQSRPTKTIIVIAALAILTLTGLWYLQATRAHATTYTEPSLGIFFSVPAGFHVQKIVDDSGETILVQSPASTHGFQIFVRFFTDPGSSITRARVEQEVGETVTNDAPLTVAGVAQGLQFDFPDDTPPTHQVWFVHDGFLYQTEAVASDESLLNAALSSWRFTGK